MRKFYSYYFYKTIQKLIIRTGSVPMCKVAYPTGETTFTPEAL